MAQARHTKFWLIGNWTKLRLARSWPHFISLKSLINDAMSRLSIDEIHKRADGATLTRFGPTSRSPAQALLDYSTSLSNTEKYQKLPEKLIYFLKKRLGKIKSKKF